MAKAKTKQRPGGRRTARPPEPKARPRGRYGSIIWIAMIAVAAAGAFLIAKQQAQGPSEAVAPPATGLPKTPDYHSLLVAPSDPRRVLLGTHVGIYESTDGGRSWKFAGLEGDDAMNLARPSGKTVWMAGHMVFKKSTDGGQTWVDVDPGGLPSLDIHGFAVDPGDPRRLLAAVAGEGLYRSTDAGQRFVLVSHDVGPGVFGLAVTPGGRVFAADPERGLFASDNGGKSWRSSTRERVVGVAINPADEDTLLTTGKPGILLSRDGGKTWQTAFPLPQGAGPVAWAPSDPELAYVVGFDRTLYRTTDRGATWQPVA